MKARVEGIRALAVKLDDAHRSQSRAREDRRRRGRRSTYHQGQVDLLVPLVKAYGSRPGVPRSARPRSRSTAAPATSRTTRSSSTAATRRSSRSTRARTTSRRWTSSAASSMQRGGANLQAFGEGRRRVRRGATRSTRRSRTAIARARPGDGSADRDRRQVHAVVRRRQARDGAAVANRFLEMMAETTIGWLLLEQARDRARGARRSSRPDHPDRGVLRRQAVRRRSTSRTTSCRASRRRRS